MKFRKSLGLFICVLMLLSFLAVFPFTIPPVHATSVFARIQGPARGTSTSNSISVTMGQAPVSSNSLVATIGTRGNGAAVSISSITQTGVTWSQAVDTTSGWQDLAIWLGVVTSGGNASITVSLSGNAANGGVALCL
jgi:hypothetical protein